MSEFLNYYPVRICEYNVENDRVTVFYKEEKPNFLLRKFFKKLAEKPYKIDLDEVGSFIWLLCDGQKNIREIITISQDHFGEKIEPADDRVQKFIKHLHVGRFIRLYSKK